MWSPQALAPLCRRSPGIEDVTYYTNENIFDLREKPKHLMIIGGGPIGMEMAQAHRRLGCNVTVIEGAKALGKDDPEMAAIVLENLRAEGVNIVEEAQAEKISGKDGTITVHTPKGDFTGSHLLMAVGRKVNTEKLDLDAGGIAYDRAGLKVGPDLRSVTNKKVYAAGDVAGGLQFTHVAGYHAGVLIRSMLFGLPSKQRTDHIPWATYTDPELAQVGLTEAQANKKFGPALEVVRFDFHHNDRADCGTQDQGSDQGDGGQRPPCRGLYCGAYGGRVDRHVGHGHRQQNENVRHCQYRPALSDGQ